MTAPTLATFLLERLAEDEAAALAALNFFEREWTSEHLGVTRHIARHDPARVLADVEAKRAVVALHSATEGRCETCHIYAVGVADNPDACPTLRALAKPYVGSDGWREEWA